MHADQGCPLLKGFAEAPSSFCWLHSFTFYLCFYCSCWFPPPSLYFPSLFYVASIYCPLLLLSIHDFSVLPSLFVHFTLFPKWMVRSNAIKFRTPWERPILPKLTCWPPKVSPVRFIDWLPCFIPLGIMHQQGPFRDDLSEKGCRHGRHSKAWPINDKPAHNV